LHGVGGEVGMLSCAEDELPVGLWVAFKGSLDGAEQLLVWERAGNDGADRGEVEVELAVLLSGGMSVSWPLNEM
jgi:hypothetical protein